MGKFSVGFIKNYCLYQRRLGKDFIAMRKKNKLSKRKLIKEKVDFIKIKHFPLKNTAKRMKRKATNWEQIFVKQMNRSVR